MNAMVETANHSQVIAEIKTSLSLLLYSLSHATPATEPISTPTPVLSPPLLPLSNPTTHPIPKPTPPARYPIKYLSYSEMQTRRDHGLCLNCDERYAPAHHCQTKRILVVLLDEDYLNLKSHPPLLTSLLTTTVTGCMTTPPSPKFPTPPPTSVVAAAPTPLTTAATNSTAPAPPLPQPSGPAAPFLHLLSLPTMAPSSPVKPYNSTHQIVKYFSDSHIEFLLGIPDTLHIMSRKQQLKIALNSFDKSKLVRPQIAIGCGAVFEQKYRKDETSPYIKMLSESKVFVFDPGGTLRIARVFDLEDKVDLEGVGNDTNIHTKAAHSIMQGLREQLTSQPGSWTKKKRVSYATGQII